VLLHMTTVRHYSLLYKTINEIDILHNYIEIEVCSICIACLKIVSD